MFGTAVTLDELCLEGAEQRKFQVTSLEHGRRAQVAVGDEIRIGRVKVKQGAKLVVGHCDAQTTFHCVVHLHFRFAEAMHVRQLAATVLFVVKVSEKCNWTNKSLRHVESGGSFAKWPNASSL